MTAKTQAAIKEADFGVGILLGMTPELPQTELRDWLCSALARGLSNPPTEKEVGALVAVCGCALARLKELERL